MASNKKWYEDKLAGLIQEDQRVSTLSELRDHLKSLPHEEASRIVSALQLPLVFDCLNDTNTEQVDLACDVLTLCLSTLHLGESTVRYKSALERALIHPFPSVKLMALKEIERSLSDDGTLCALCDEVSLITNVILCMGDDTLSVGKRASDIVVALGTTIPGANKMSRNEILMAFQEVMSKNEVVRLRVYEAIILISKQSEASFKQFLSIGFIGKIVDEINSNDVLLKLNIIELLSQLTESEHGYNFLDETDVLNKILSLMLDGSLSELVEPGILKFFGQIGRKRPRELLAKYPVFFDHLFSNIELNNTTIIGISIDTIGYIGETSQGKIALNSTGSKIEGTIQTLVNIIRNVSNDIRLRILTCFENLLRDDSYDVMQITEKWFRLLGPDPMALFFRYANTPDAALRLAALGVLNALAGQQWGQEAIKNTPGLMEFLLDRSENISLDCKTAKYAVVKLLSNSTLFDHNLEERIRNFVKEGPYFVPTVTEVAIEGN